MKTFSGARSSPFLPLLLGVLPLLLLTACATTQRDASDHETVDVGYGSIERDQLTGSTSSVSSKDLQGAQPQTLAEMLARIPGVTVVNLTKLHGGLSVRIRGGTNSMQGGEEPLFVLDGMPMASGNGEIFNINPNTVESITVLKDAGTTAIYGSRGANGVILIKTKRGG